MLKSIAVIGSGNVATNLAAAISSNGNYELLIYGRSSEKANVIAKTYGAQLLDNIQHTLQSDLVLISVTDDALPLITKELANASTPIAHTSGSQSIKVFEEHSIHNYGVFYPLQSLTAESPIDFKQVPLCIEFNNERVNKLLFELANRLSNQVEVVDSEKRAALHLSAVFANNFTNHLYEISDKLLQNKGLTFDLLRPLILRTAEKVQHNSPYSQQTGPAVRGDEETMKKHLSQIDDNEIKLIYQLFSKRIKATKTSAS